MEATTTYFYNASSTLDYSTTIFNLNGVYYALGIIIFVISAFFILKLFKD